MLTGFHFAKCMFSTFFQSGMIANLEKILKWKKWKRYWFKSKFGSENKMAFVKMVSTNLLHTYLITKSFKMIKESLFGYYFSFYYLQEHTFHVKMALPFIPNTPRRLGWSEVWLAFSFSPRRAEPSRAGLTSRIECTQLRGCCFQFTVPPATQIDSLFNAWGRRRTHPHNRDGLSFPKVSG